MEGCPMYNLITTSVRIMQLQPFLTRYCLSVENHMNCVRYGLKKLGKMPDDRLLPDGAFLKN